MSIIKIRLVIMTLKHLNVTALHLDFQNFSVFTLHYIWSEILNDTKCFLVPYLIWLSKYLISESGPFSKKSQIGKWIFDPLARPRAPLRNRPPSGASPAAVPSPLFALCAWYSPLHNSWFLPLFSPFFSFLPSFLHTDLVKIWSYFPKYKLRNTANFPILENQRIYSGM